METKKVKDFRVEIVQMAMDEARFSRLYTDKYFLVGSGADLEERAKALSLKTTSLPAGQLNQSLEEDSLVYLIEFANRQDKIKIGRSGNCEIQIPKEYGDVSSFHAYLRKDGDQFFLYDVKSTCGTSLGTKQIPSEVEVEIFDGAPIKLAKSYRLTFFEPKTAYHFFKDLFRLPFKVP